MSGLFCVEVRRDEANFPNQVLAVLRRVLLCDGVPIPQACIDAPQVLKDLEERAARNEIELSKDELPMICHAGTPERVPA